MDGFSEAQGRLPKFTAFQSYLVRKAVPRALRCETCRWWVRPEASPGSMAQCRVVDGSGPPTFGEIPAGATCSLWNAGPVRLRFQEALRGRGAASEGLGSGVFRVRMERVLVPKPWTTPPAEVAAKVGNG